MQFSLHPRAASRATACSSVRVTPLPIAGPAGPAGFALALLSAAWPPVLCIGCGAAAGVRSLRHGALAAIEARRDQPRDAQLAQLPSVIAGPGGWRGFIR
jgi:hypothetical protein